MNDYVKYDELKEKVDRFKLTELGIDSKVRNDFYAHYQDLQTIREIETANGSLTEEEQAKKEAYMRAIDHWINSFIEDRKVAIQKDIDTFEKHVKKIIEKFEEVKAMFVLDNIVGEDINKIIQGIESDFKGLIDEANKLLSDIDELKELAKGYTDSLEFTVTYTDVKKKLTDLKEKLKTIKNDQVAKYNTAVIATNAEISKMKEEFANKEGLSDEVLADLAKLQELNQCTVNVSKWNQTWHMTEEYLSYNKLKEMLLLINQIKVKMGMKIPEPEIDLESDIKHIEDKLVEIDGKIKDEMAMNEIKPLLDELSYVSGKITEFEIKLKENKDKISEEKYNEYLGRVESARNKLEELRKKLFERIPNLYKTLSEELESLNNDISHLEFYVESLFGKITKEALSVYEEKLNFYEGRLSEIKDNIEKINETGKLEDNQYAELKKKIEEIENKLNKIRSNIKDPKIVAEIEKMDIFELFNGQIDGIEKAIDALETKINGLDKPIKDRKVRQEIDKKLIAIEQEIKDVEKFLEKYKDQDSEKYDAAKQRLEGLKERLNKISKEYRKKCPLHVRAIKSAKNIYKKHPKATLVIAGLAAMSLITAPVLIPAIMHGNIMIANTTPALKGFIKFVNNILGSRIGAVKTADNLWKLSSGMIIDPLSGTSSLLKGLAISGYGNAVLMSPIIATLMVSIRELIKKIKQSQLKKELEEKSEVKHQKEEKKEKKSNPEKEEKKSKMKVLKAVSEYLKKPENVDVIIERNNLTEEEKAEFEQIINIQNRQRGGR